MGLFYACDKVDDEGNRCKNTTKEVAFVANPTTGVMEPDWQVTPDGVLCPTCKVAKEAQEDQMALFA